MRLLVVVGLSWVLSSAAQAAVFAYEQEAITVAAKNAEATFDEAGKLHFKTGLKEPGEAIVRPRRDPSWDMSGFQAIELILRNPGPIRVVPQVTVRSPSDVLHDWENGVENSLYLGPGETKHLLVYFRANDTIAQRLYPWVKEMRSGPNTQLFWWKGVDAAAIQSIIFSALDVSGPDEFQQGEYLVESVRPVKYHELFNYPAENQFPFVDLYGQFKQGAWPGKLRDADEFPARMMAEQEDLEAHPRPPAWDQWGGWAGGPKLDSTGYFYVKEVDGRWWLVDPDGRLFWSHGATGVGGVGSSTPISGRENYLELLPEKDSPLGQFITGGAQAIAYDFYGANLYRKYGDDYQRKATDSSGERLASWGMNTCGCWSRSEALAQSRAAYTVFVSYSVRNLTYKLPDVWDPAFEEKLKNILRGMQTGGVADSPWNIGFFVHNEIKFGGPQNLARIIQGKPADQPAKIAWVKRLGQKYGEIEKLNQAWKVGYASWDDLLTSQEKVPYAQMAEDANDCFEDYLDRFFRISREACKEAFPNHLYLGSRLHGIEHPMVMKAAEKYCDVISYNLYLKTLAGWTGPTADLSKPVMATEWHFGALDRGMFNTGLQPASSQEDRGEHYYEYVKSALKNPLIVGTHWFQYQPQCLTGRGDGENYQIGMVDITDTPYPELIRAVRKIGNQLYEIRHEGKDSGPF